MDGLMNLLIGDLEVLPEVVVVVRLICVMFGLELFALVASLLSGVGRR